VPVTDEAPDYRNIVDVLGQASLACFTSGARYWMRVSEVLARHYPVLSRGILDVNDDGADAARGTLVDGARACLRELAELPAQEAQRLCVELERLGERLPPAADGDGPAPRRRRWRAKP
jgi:hypothetical protein